MGDTHARARGSLTMVWKDKSDVHILMNIHRPPEGNFCDKYVNPQKPVIVEYYSRHIAYINKADRKANS
jgi:hypothetical protein